MYLIILSKIKGVFSLLKKNEGTFSSTIFFNSYLFSIMYNFFQMGEGKFS